jgi:predicted nucleic acid-binding protein
MITAIDTNVFLDILLPDETFYEASAKALEAAATAGSLVICDLVYAELCVHFAAQKDCEAFLDSNDIRVEPLTRAAHFTASRVWRAYRRQGGQRTRILTDFLIGAHAQTQASRLLSRDRGFYQKLFPNLDLMDPVNWAKSK